MVVHVNDICVPAELLWNVIRIEEDVENETRKIYRNRKLVHQGELTSDLNLLIPIYTELGIEAGEAQLLIQKYGHVYYHSIKLKGKLLESVVNEHKKRFSSWQVELVNVLIKREPQKYFVVYDEIHKRLYFDGRTWRKPYSSNIMEFERCDKKFVLQQGSRKNRILSELFLEGQQVSYYS